MTVAGELERLAAACLFPGFVGAERPPEWVLRWAEAGLGGVVLFARNIGTDAELRALTDALHGAREDLIVATDEGTARALLEPVVEGLEAGAEYGDLAAGAGAGVAPEIIRATAREAEALGYSSFWVNHPGSMDGLGALAHAAGDTRRMRASGHTPLEYYLFADPGYSIPWGDGESMGNPDKGAADGGKPTRLTIYGIVPAQSRIDAGEYDDSLQVTLTF